MMTRCAMSSPGSAVTIELPRRTLADRVTWVLVAVAAAAVELVARRQLQAPVGAGLALALALGLLHCRAVRSRPTAVTLGSATWRLHFHDGTLRTARPGAGTRLLGPTVVLHWRAGRGSGRAWLSPLDLPHPSLRAVILRLRADAAGRMR
jgi:hypothetical protein